MLELIAVILTLLCVYLTRQNKILSWPMGMLASVAYFLVFLDVKLYGEMMLQILFFTQGIYGWYVWSDKNPNEVFIVNKMSLLVFILHFSPILLLAKIIHELILPNNNVWDLVVAIISIVATYYTARKIDKAWSFWVVVNIISIILFTYKELYLSAVLYSILLVIAISGLIKWEKMSSYEKI